MKFKKKIIGIVGGVMAFSGIVAAGLLSGSTSGGVVFNGPLTNEWLQSSTVASDRSPSHNHMTVNGGVTFGADGATFNGTTGYLRAAIADYRDSDFSGSLEAWYTPNSTGGDTQIWFTSADEASLHNFIYARVNSTGELAISTKNGIADVQDYVYGNTVLNVGQLYHLVITTNGSRYKFYVDGVDEGALTAGIGVNDGRWFADIDNRDNLAIGAWVINTSSLFADALISNVKIYNKELSVAEIQSSFDKGPTGGGLKTGSLSEGLIYDSPLKSGWMQDATTISDRAAAHSHGNVTGATVGTDSTDFNGTTDDISIPGLITTLADSTVGTICTMSNVDIDDGFQNTIFALGRDADSVSTRFLVDYRMNDLDSMDILFNVDGVTQWRWKGANEETDALIGVDFQLCISQDGVEPKVYYNGVRNIAGVFSTSTDKTQWFDDLFAATSPPDTATIGALPANGGHLIYFDGQISDVKIWDRPLSAEEILLNYETSDRSLSNGSLFSQMVSWWPSTTDWLQSAATISDRSTAHNHMTIGGAPTIGAISTDYNGTTDYSKVSIADYRSGDSAGTVMAWVNMDAFAGSTDILDSADEAGSLYYFRFGTSSTSKIFVQQSSNDTVTTVFGNTTLSVDTWYLAALTSNGAAWKLYVDASEDTPYNVISANNGDWFADTPNRDSVTIGALVRSTVSSFANGEIADVRVFDRELTQEEIQLHFDQTCYIYSAC